MDRLRSGIEGKNGQNLLDLEHMDGEYKSYHTIFISFLPF